MKKLIFILLPLFMISATADFRQKDHVAEQLIGTWIQKQDSDKTSLRFVKADHFEKNTQGLTFREDGTVLMQMPFGCQLPPHFLTFKANWKVLNKSTVEVDRHFPGEVPDKMKIVKLNQRVLRFNYK